MNNGNTFNFPDLFKNNVLESAVSQFSAVDVSLSLLISFLIGLFIYAVYKKLLTG